MTSRNRRSPKKRRRRFGSVHTRPNGDPYIQFVMPNAPRDKNGRRKVTTRSVTSKAEGTRLLDEIERAILRGTFAPQPEPEAEPANMTVVEALDEYITVAEAAGRAEKTVLRYRGNRAVFAKSALGKMGVADVMPTDVEKFMSWRRERRYWVVRDGDEFRVKRRKGATATNATINRDLLLLSASFNRLKRLGQIAENPVERVPRLRETRKRRAVLSKEEAAKLLDACSVSLRPLVLGGLLTGARARELIELRWRDIDFARKTVTLNRTKSHVVATIPLHPVLAKVLRSIRKTRRPEPTDHVFLSSRGTPFRYYRKAWQTAVIKASLEEREGLVFHSLRHSFATEYLSGGAAITDLQGLLGHSSVATTQLYSAMVDKRARASLEALGFGSADACANQ